MTESSQAPDNESAGLPASNVQIGPVPLDINVGIAQLPNGYKALVLIVMTPQGTQYFFMPPELAYALADQLKDFGKQVETDIIVPPSAGIEIAR